MTPLSYMAPLAHASNICYCYCFSSYLFHFILPDKRPSKILLTFICSHFEGIKFFFEGGCACTGKGSLY